jgi:hypothetical protein
VPSGGATRVFFPAYYNHSWSSAKGPSESHFDGIELPRRYSGCLTALYRIPDRRRFPLLLDMTLAPAWEQAMPFQTLTAIEHLHSGGAPAFYTAPADLVVTRSAFAEGAQSISNDVTDRAGMATRSRNGAWAATGRADGPQSSLFRFRGRTVLRHSVLVAEGELHTGGVSFGLLAGMHAGVKVSVTEPGPFVVALEAPADGEFAVAVANDIVPWWPASHIGRRVGPLVGWIPGATLRTDVVVNRIGWWSDGSRRE